MKWIRYYKPIIWLAFPIIISNLSQMILGIIDSAMVGAVSSELLASAALVNSLIAIPYILAMGLTIGLSPLVSITFGERNYNLLNKYLFNGLAVCLTIACIIAISIHFGSDVIFYLGQETEVARQGEQYLQIMGWSVIPMILFLTLKQFSDGIEMPRWPMYIALLSIPLNTFLNYLFIFGNFGFPAMGLTGAGYATLISRIFIFILLLILILVHPKYKTILGTWGKNMKIDFSIQKRILKIGIPTSLQYGMESWAFAFSGIMIGWLGSKSLAAHQIALSIAAFTFMGAMGLSAAGSIRVGVEYGKRNFKRLHITGLATIHLSLIYGLICAILMVIFREKLPFYFNNETEVVHIAATLLIFAAIFQISDSAQATGVGLCRGIQDIMIPTLLVFIAYWICGIPLGYILAFKMGMGASGIWIGFLIGLSISAILLNFRFNRTAKRLRLRKIQI